MAAIITPQSPHIERPFGWKTWRVKLGTLTGTSDETVVTLPAYTIILAGRIVVLQAPVGDGGATCDIEIGATGAGDTALLSGGADFLGTLGNTESVTSDANLTTINALAAAGGANVVNATTVWTGTATTTAIFEVSLLCGRNVI